VNQVCQLLGKSREDLLSKPGAGRALKGEISGLATGAGSAHRGASQLWLPRLKKALAEQEGRVVNAKLLRKLLRWWGLNWQRKAGAGQHQPSWVQQIIGELGDKANLVRKPPITGCFQVLVTDMTQLPYQAGIAYLGVHLDWYGKLVYVSYSRPATPGDNPVNESFFSRLKAEWGEMFGEAKTFEALEQPVSRAIAYYNTERYHTSIGCQTPAQFTQQYVDHLTLESF
jgi:hypothetical protein